MKLLNLFITGLLIFTLAACGGGDKPSSESKAPAKSMVKKEEPKAEAKAEADPMKDIGVGPIKEAITFGELDEALVAKGKELYHAKCTACHKEDKKYIGPAPKDIYQRRNPAWVMNMILNPDGMIKEDPTAKKLLQEFNGTPMSNQSLTEEEARSIVEYFRTL